MDRIDIVYVVIALLIVLNIILICVSVKCAHKVDDDFEFRDEDGDHIYYDRKLIRHKQNEYNNKES